MWRFAVSSRYAVVVLAVAAVGLTGSWLVCRNSRAVQTARRGEPSGDSADTTPAVPVDRAIAGRELTRTAIADEAGTLGARPPRRRVAGSRSEVVRAVQLGPSESDGEDDAGAEAVPRLDDGSDDRSSESPIAVAMARERKYAQDLDHVVAEEPRDAGWAWAIESGLRSDLGRSDLGSASVAGCECRTSLCRVQLRFRTADEREQFMSGARLAGVMRNLGGMFVRLDSWEDLDIEMYVARDGQSLPGPSR